MAQETIRTRGYHEVGVNGRVNKVSRKYIHLYEENKDEDESDARPSRRMSERLILEQEMDERLT